MKLGLNKDVKIVGFLVGESKEKKTPYYEIEFENKEGETIYSQHYYSTKEFTKQDGSKSNMVKENQELLINMGFKGKSESDMADESKSVSDLFNLVDGGIAVFIEAEEFTTDSGEVKTSNKVKYVNAGGGRARIDKAAAVKTFAGFAGNLMQARQASKVVAVEAPVENSEVSEDEIPF
jgi:hypothetical protein